MEVQQQLCPWFNGSHAGMSLRAACQLISPAALKTLPPAQIALENKTMGYI